MMQTRQITRSQYLLAVLVVLCVLPVVAAGVVSSNVYILHESFLSMRVLALF